MPKPALKSNETVFAVRDYDLAATLGCGQAFRWELSAGRWHGVVGSNLVALEQRGPSPAPSAAERAEVNCPLHNDASTANSGETRPHPAQEPSAPPTGLGGRQPSGALQDAATVHPPPERYCGAGVQNVKLNSANSHPGPLPYAGGEGVIVARTVTPQTDWRWLEDYLQIHVDLPAIFATFPQDAPMQIAVERCHGLRLLRQEPWECLASFILSSTKQIVQIRQIVVRLCELHGDQNPGFAGEPAFAFPTPEQIAALSEAQLRQCKMGFRAPYLRAAARRVADGALDLAGLARLELAEARAHLLSLPGVGPKIADCVLLFACGFPTAFPVDVWVMRALRQFYFRNRRIPLARLREFSTTHFGPHGGYAQQYLFHSLRLDQGKKLSH